MWPGCIKPISAKNGEKIDAIKQKFDKGECKEPEAANCPETPPEVYCKQGLCVFRYKSATQQP